MTRAPEPSANAPLRWGVVSTLREPQALALSFACHHLALGATALHLYLDDPNDPGAAMLSVLPRCQVTLCNDTYWHEVHGRARPPSQTARQTANANHALRNCGLDALLHIDADEFLWLPDPLEAEWARMRPGDAWLWLPNLERVWLTDTAAASVFDGVFRAPLFDRPDLAETVYGPMAGALGGGLAGHASGKAMARPGNAVFLAIHKVKDGGPHGIPLPHATAQTARILHFDGLTPRHWVLKMLRYAAMEPTSAQRLLNRVQAARVGLVREAPDPVGAALDLHRALYLLDGQQAALLESEDRLLRNGFDPSAALTHYLKDKAPGLDPDAFDTVIENDLDRLRDHIRSG